MATANVTAYPAHLSASNSAPQQMSGVTSQEPALPKPPSDKPLSKGDNKASETLNAQMPLVSADFPRMPAVMPTGFRELSGDLSARPVEPEIIVTPVPKVQAAPTEDETKRRRSQQLRDKIVALQAQKDELLKTFYEDAIPVRHVTEDLAKAEAELQALFSKKAS